MKVPRPNSLAYWPCLQHIHLLGQVFNGPFVERVLSLLYFKWKLNTLNIVVCIGKWESFEEGNFRGFVNLDAFCDFSRLRESLLNIV